MNSVLDDLLVGAVLLASLGYAVTKLGPRSLKKRVFTALGAMLASAPAILGLGGVAQRLANASGKTQGACGGCDNCGTEPSAVPRPQSEINVPVARIGRRV
ncbi:MAG TPA: DUF6587 family protein [Steroidobacteraceae bacterium]|jgi:hypothetical protein|nr:DUF6587 family protein [Steroidobacteraceae bacterium]